MIDLRSDTVTKPSKEMRKAAYDAEVGDDVYREDPTVNKLEAIAADHLGKEAALFVTSGTQGNQIAVLTHCNPGDELILESNAHIFLYEGAAVAALAGVQSRPIEGIRGAMNPEDVKAAIRTDDIHFPETSLICLENTHNKAGGAIVPLENMKSIYQIAQNANLAVHLDGARLFNAAVSSGISPKEYAKYTDTVQFCLSKGLGAPVGSIIAGSQNFINSAKKWRKRLGGGLRQSGIIAAPGIIALERNVERLVEDHQNARILAGGLANIAGLKVANQVETNMVLIDVSETGLSEKSFLEAIRQEGVLAGAYGTNHVRFVTHLDVTKADIEAVLQKIRKALKH